MLSEQLPRLTIPHGQGVLGGGATVDKLKAPFPAFGGKSRVAHLVWERLGDVDNFIEPFANSAAVLLARPHAPRIETLNDMDCYISNFWRSTSTCPELVAEWADDPVSECDMHARHRWLVLSHSAIEFRRRMKTEPGYFDARVAGWWVHGICCWIGSGWCQTPESAEWDQLARIGTDAGQGVHAIGRDNRKPRIDGGNGQYGHGIHSGRSAAISQQLPLIGDLPRGVHRGAGELHVKRPRAASEHLATDTGLPGVCGQMFGDANRPQLADAYSRGRGVNGNDAAGTCEQRRAWLVDWFQRLRDRLRTVRVCCGDWLRVCDSESVTTRLGVTGLFLDPPYGHGSGRQEAIYSTDSMTVAADVRRYCLERGDDQKMRICLAGYQGEGHDVLEKAGWDVVSWNSPGGYGNRSAKGKANSKKERLWFSPACQRPAQYELFAPP